MTEGGDMSLYSDKFLIFALSICLISASGCGEEQQVSQKPPLVKTMKVEINKTAQDHNFSGIVCSRYETNLAFQVSGRILSRNVQVGSSVRSGDILMSIDNRDILQHSNQGEAQVAAAKAQLELSKSNLTRYSQLYKDNAIPASMLDQYQTEYDSSLAAYENAVAQAKQSHNELSYTNLTANAAGVISAVNAEEGQVVSAGQTVMTLSQTDELEVEINIPESHIQDVSIGKSVTVSFWALNGETIGNIREISPIADNAARTYRVRVTLPQPPSEIQLGMTANVTLTENEDHTDINGILLPISAIYQTGDNPQVWVVENDTVHLKPVKIEDFVGDEVRVHGIKSGSIVVTAGVNKLHEDQTVRVSAK